MKEAMKFDYSGIRALENEMVRIIAENKDALVSAWVAETGNLPSDSVICSGWKDGVMRTWVETKAENDKRAHVAPLYTKEQYGI